MLKRLLVGLATLVLVAGGAAFYLLYALKPPPSSRPAETVVLTVQGATTVRADFDLQVYR